MKRQFARAALLARVVLGATSAAHAQPGGDLGPVEEAYRAVDFEAVLRLSEAAIHKGGHDPERMARLEFLLGIANAALDHPQQAQAAFIRLLGIDPSQKLEKELSPRLRGPYLEARGFWSSNRERMSASARVESGALRISLSDPAQMVHRIRVSWRAIGQTEFQDSLHPAAATVRVALGADRRLDEIEVALTLLDEFGNRLAEEGTKLAPIRLERGARSAETARTATTSHETPRAPNYLLPTTLSVLGLASTATAITFHVQRERAAREWNGHACERPGSSRGEQCADVERRIRRDEWLSVGFYAGGAALLTLGVVTFITNHAAQRERTSEAVSCDAVASSTLGVWCAGRF